MNWRELAALNTLSIVCVIASLICIYWKADGFAVAFFVLAVCVSVLPKSVSVTKNKS